MADPGVSCFYNLVHKSYDDICDSKIELSSLCKLSAVKHDLQSHPEYRVLANKKRM